jgi:hypothetical protein
MAEQTLRPYNPSWADKLAAHLYDMTSKSPEARNFVGGLMGGTGLGRTQMGVVDATPLGVPLGIQEAYNNGDAKGMALAALPMPVKAAGMGMVKAAAKEAAPAVERGIVAYHGSPHSFDRFDISKIGTGEGAQAYGHGLYFADNEDVAKSYREFLSSRNNDLTDPGNLAASLLYRTPEGTREAAIREAQTVINSVDRMPAAYKHDPGVRERTQKALELLQSGAELPKQGGSMYQVRINADPEHFLDWDKPLSEQSPVVREAIDRSPYAIRDGAMDNFGSTDPKGAHLYMSELSAPEMSEHFKELGVPGIKYFDQGSRGSGVVNRTNNYVMFDDKLIDILKKYGLSGLLAGSGGMGMLQAPQSEQAAEM